MFTGNTTPIEPRQMTDEELQLVIDQIVRNRNPKDLAEHAFYLDCLEIQRERRRVGTSVSKTGLHYRV